MSTLTAAIQFGSSRISAVAASIEPEGGIVVHGIESVTTSGCIRHGCVVNTEDTAICIKSVMKKLSNRLVALGHGELDAAYVGICGISMHSIEYSPKVMINDETLITNDLHEQLLQQSNSLPIQGKDIFGIKVNNERIEGNYAIADHQLILGNQKIQAGIIAAMERAHIKIKGIFASPLIIADTLYDEEKTEGCVLIDMGAQLSSISIYKDNQLKYMNVLPMGGECVTKDIATKGMRIEEAEDAKINWANAAPQCTQEPTNRVAQNMQIPVEELNLIVISRYDEIVSNIAHLIEVAGYKGMLNGGCIVTGGASTQKGLTSLIRKRLDICKISTRTCSAPRFSNSERKPHLTALMSMLNHCTESCVAIKTEAATQPAPAAASIPQPVSTTNTRRDRNENGVKKGIKDFLGDLFSGLDSDN